MTDGRRWSDDELRELAALVKEELPSVFAFANGNKKRAIINWSAVGGVAALLGMLQVYLLRPIEAKIDHTESVVAQVQSSVQKHHEESAFIYVTQQQYQRDQDLILREIRGLRDLIIITEQKEKR